MASIKPDLLCGQLHSTGCTHEERLSGRRSQTLNIQLRSPNYATKLPLFLLTHVKVKRHRIIILHVKEVCILLCQPNREKVSVQEKIGDISEHGFYNKSNILPNTVQSTVKQHNNLPRYISANPGQPQGYNLYILDSTVFSPEDSLDCLEHGDKF